MRRVRAGHGGRGRRVAVIALDGVPYSGLLKLVEGERLPALAALIGDGTVLQMRSVIPTVSCVAWASFVTGAGPGSHGVFGFTDRRPGTYEIHVPNAGSVRGPTLWRLLCERNRRCIVINVPVTYPPPKLRGLTLVAGFLAPRLRSATHPASLAPRLEKLGYGIDVNAQLAQADLRAFVRDANDTVEARQRAAVELMTREPWDFLMCHFMAPDRVNHFLWRS